MKARLSDGERCTVRRLLHLLGSEHLAKLIEAPSPESLQYHDWEIADYRQRIFKICGLVLTDENDWTMPTADERKRAEREVPR